MAEEIIFELSGDSQGALDAIQEVIDALDELRTALEEIGGLFTVIDDLAGAFSGLASSVSDAATTATNASTAYMDLAAAIQTAADALNNFNAAAGNTTAGTGSTSANNVQEEAAAEEQLLQIGPELTSVTEDVTAAFDGLNNALGNSVPLIEQNAGAIVDENGVIQGQVQTLGDWTGILQDSQQEYLRQILDMEMGNQGWLDATTAIEQNTNQLTGNINAQLQAANVIPEVNTAWQEYINAVADVLQINTQAAAGLSEIDRGMAEIDPSVQFLRDNYEQLAQAYIDQANAVTQSADANNVVEGSLSSLNDVVDASIGSAQQASDTFSGLGNDLNGSFAPQVEQTSSIFQNFQENLASFAEWGPAIQSFGQQVGSAFSSVFQNVRAMVMQFANVNAATAQVDSAFYDMQTAFQNVGNIAAPVANAAGDVGAAFQNVADAATAFNPVGDFMGGVLTDLGDKFMKVTGLSAIFGTSEEAAGAGANKAGQAFGGEAFMLMQLAGALIQLTTSFLQMGINAQLSISRITGLADQSLAAASGSSRLDGVINTLSADAIKYGVSLKDASDGLYYIISAGFDTADSLKILSYSMETASATGATMTSISSALTSVLKNYNLGAAQAGVVTNQMVQAVVSGKQNFQDYANVIGELSSVASRTGVSFTEVSAAEAEMSQQNPRILRDSQDLMHLMETLSFKTSTMAKAAKGLGISFNSTAFSSMDLMQKLQYLSKIAGGDTTTAFNKLLTDQTSARAAFMLLTNSGKNYAGILQQISHNTNALAVAFQQSQATISSQLAHVTAALSVLSYRIVVLITPAVTVGLQLLSHLFALLTQNTQILLPVITALAVFIGVILVGAITILIGMLAGVIGPIVQLGITFGLLAGIIVAITPLAIHLVQSFTPLMQLFRAIQAAVTLVGMAFMAQLAPILPIISRDFSLIIQNVQKFVASFGPQVVGGISIFLTVIQTLTNFIVTSFIPTLMKIIVGAMQLGVYLSSNLGPIFTFIGTVMHAVMGATAGVNAFFVALRIGALIPLIGPLVTSIGLFLSGIIPALAGVIATILPLIGSLLALVGAFVATNFIAIAVAVAVGLAVFGFMQFASKTQVVQGVVRAVGSSLQFLWGLLVSSLKPALDSIVLTVQGTLIPAWQHLVAACAPLAPMVQQLGVLFGAILVGALGVAIGVIGGLIRAFGTFIQYLAVVIGAVIQFASGVVQVIVALFGLLVGIFTGNGAMIAASWHNLWIGIIDIVTGIFTAIIGVIVGALMTIISFIGGFCSTVINFFSNLASDLVGHSIIPDMLNAMLASFTSFASSALGVIGGFISGAISRFSSFAVYALMTIVNMALAISARIQAMGAQMLSAITSAFSGMVNAVSSGASNMIARVQSMGAQIGSTMMNLASQAFSWGYDFIGQMTSGVASAAGGLIGRVQSLAGSIASMLHFSVPDEGPLKDADRWMPDMGDMLASGLADQTTKISKSAQSVALAVAGAAPSANSLGHLSTSQSNATQSQHSALLQAILGELQKQTQQGAGANNVNGHPLPSTSIGSVTQTFNNNGGNGGNAGLNAMYQQFNILAGIAVENTSRGAIGGLGI